MKKHYFSRVIGCFIAKSLFTISIFLISLIPLKGFADNLTTVAATASHITDSETYANVVSTANIDVTHVDKILVYATFTSQSTVSENVKRTLTYRFKDELGTPNTSNEILRHLLADKTGDKSIGSLYYIFDVSVLSGNKQYTLQHKVSVAKNTETVATIVAVALNTDTDPYPALNNDMKAITTGITTTSTSFVAVTGLTTDAINLPVTGGFLVAASINCDKTAPGSGDDTGEWGLQMRKGSGSYSDIGNSVQRTMSTGSDIGIVTLIALLEEQPASNYNFRVVDRIVTGSTEIETLNTTLVAVALGYTGGKHFACNKSTVASANTTLTTAVAANTLSSVEAEGTSMLLLGQFGTQADAECTPSFSLTASGGSVTSNILQRYLENSSARGAGSFTGLVTGLTPSSSYNLVFNHYIPLGTGQEITTTNIILGAIQLTDTDSPGYWTGASSTVWNLSGNWSDGNIPTSSINVTLANKDNDPVIGAAATCKSLTVDASASLNIAYNGNLTVAEDFSNSGTFTVNSTTDGTGSLMVAGSSAGNVIFKRYVDDNFSKALKWHYVSAPVAGQALNTDWMTNNSISFANPAYQFYRWDEDTDFWIYYGYTGTEPEDFGDATFVAARGYAATRTAAGELSFTGTVRVEDVSYAATYTAAKGVGCNLVGNPFTSSIGVTTGASSTENFIAQNTALLDDSYEALYIWDEQTGYTGNRNDYKVISNVDIIGYTEIEQDYIQPGQAFMVKVVSDGGSLAFNENMQAHASVDYYKNSKELWPSVELIVENNELFNSTAIGFKENMTLGLDPSYDVGKMKGNPNIALYTRLVEDNGVDFAIQALPPLSGEIIKVKIGLDINQEGDYNFKLIESENLDKTTSIKLEDKETGKLIDFRETPEYSFNVDQTGTICERFVLHFNNAAGIEDQNFEYGNISFYVYNNKLYIIDKELKNGIIQLFNLLGQPVMEKQYSKEISTINLDLTKGYYFVRVVTDKTTVSGKIYIH